MLKRYFGSRPYLLRIILPLTALLFLSGGSVYYWKSTSVRLTADGQTRRIFTSAKDIREFIEKERIPLGFNDIVTPPMDASIGHRTAVKITRVTIESPIEVSSGTPVVTWQIRNRDNLRRVLVQRGYTTRTTQTVRVIKNDGIEVSRTVLSEKKSRKPFFQLTLFNKAGQPYLTYDLLQCRVLKMRATGYYVGEKTVPSDTTFMGHKLQRGLVAIDPKIIPLGTRLYVSGYGYAYASDTGSKIKGLRIDLAVKDKYEEARFNRHDVPVYLLEKAKRW